MEIHKVMSFQQVLQQVRYDYRTAMTDMFRAKYEELKQRAEAAKSKRSTLQTDEIYQPEQKQGLVLSGGHRPLERPDNVDVPPDYQSPVGLLTPEQLEEYGSDNKGRRYLLSVYGSSARLRLGVFATFALHV